MPHSGRFQRADRVVLARDYKRMRRRGKRFASASFTISVADRRVLACEPRYREQLEISGGRRLGITVSRRVGNAVVRNRVKRSIREWFRLSRQNLERDVDIIVVARPGAGRLSTPEIFEDLGQLAENSQQVRGRTAGGETM